VLLQQSIACHVRVIVREQKLPFVWVLRIVTEMLVPQQSSVALGGSKLQAEPHSTVLLVLQRMPEKPLTPAITQQQKQTRRIFITEPLLLSAC
jgi:hypothetical protein